jgi:hypothetical protein
MYWYVMVWIWKVENSFVIISVMHDLDMVALKCLVEPPSRGFSTSEPSSSELKPAKDSSPSLGVDASRG